jgi:lipopolysaccharide/colanic/teichoic acid biosynthesis glycosyltransferase
MSRNQNPKNHSFGLTDMGSNPYFGQHIGWAVVAWCVVAGLIALTWVDQNSAGWWVVGLGVLSALLAVALERALTFTGLGSGWRYRLAFLLSAGLPVVVAITAWVESVLHSPGLHSEWMPAGALMHWMAAVLGAFTGSLLDTALNEGLWENNSPPGEAVRQEVHRLHLEQIGQPGPQSWVKRCFDLGLALVGLVLSAPVWVSGIFLIWFADPGPLLFVKNSVGKGGINFHQFKLRTMVRGAEEHTGPVLSQQGDQRVLLVGRFLRKTALDELPQLINILLGQMSFVGPRPQRTVLVLEYLERMPEYAERHRVLPGIAGLAQVAGDYYLTPRQKLRFDRLYIRHISLGFDLKLLGLAFWIAFWMRWQKNWDGRIPRNLIRWGSKAYPGLRSSIFRKK